MTDVSETIDIKRYGNPGVNVSTRNLGRVCRSSADTTALARLVISALSIAALAVWALGQITGAAELRILGGLGYCLFGVGAAPWSLVPRLPLLTRVVLTGLTTFFVFTVGATAMLAAGVWWPQQLLIVLIFLSLPAHLCGCWVAARALAATQFPPLGIADSREALALLLALTGALSCLGSALTHRHVNPGFWGFLPHVGGLWFLGFAEILLSVVLSRSSRQITMALCVTTLMFATVVTPAIVYDGPRSQSAAKHVDLIEQIRIYHGLSSSIKVYNAWPGFFGAIAWICDCCRLSDPMVLATAWPAVIGGLRLAALRFLAGVIIPDGRLAWTAAALAVLSDPMGADYFSPQSVGFVLGMICFGFAIRGRPAPAPPWCAMTAVALVGCTLAVTHQLSPYLVGGVLVLLTVFRQVRPWWTPLLVLMPTFGWIITHRGAVQGFLSLSDIGRLYNFRPPPTPATPGMHRLPIVAQTSGALAFGILLLGALALLVLLQERRNIRTWATAACPGVGLAFVMINPYGNEGIFRASLFGIPWLAVLAARAFSDPKARAQQIALGMVVGALTATFLTAAFGLDGTNVMRSSDRVMFDYLRDRTTRTDNHTILLDLGIGDLPASPPGRWGRYLTIQRDELGEPMRESGQQSPGVLAARLTQRLIAYSGREPGQASLYALWSPVSMRYGWAYGVVSPTQFAGLRDALLVSGYWKVVRKEQGTFLFRFDASRYLGEST